MKKKTEEAFSHWLAVELLSRYAEGTQAGLTVEQVYPSVHEHLTGCEVCRATLDCLLSPSSEPSIGETGQVKAGTPPELAGDALPLWAWRPGSRPDAFGLRLALKVRRAPAASELLCEWPQGGRVALKVRLSLERDKDGRLVLVGQLSGCRVAAGMRAYALLGNSLYSARVRRRRLSFEGLDFEDRLRQVGLVVETL